MARNIVGKPVQGGDFFGREQELERLWRVAHTQHVLLLAPRRVGKTSLLYGLVPHVRGTENNHAVYLSVAKVQTELAFVQKLFEEIARIPEAVPLVKRLQKGPWADLFKRIKGVTVAGTGVTFADWPADEWLRAGQHLGETLRLLQGHWFILVDELPLFVLGLLRQDPTGARARAFLQWSRDLRQGIPGEEDRIHWVIAGSIGLDTVTRRHRLTDTINDLQPMPLGPFSPEIADRFLQALCAGEQLVMFPDARRRLCELAEWLIPYHLQLLFSSLLERCRDHRSDATLNAVEAAFDDLLSPTRRLHFNFWDERLTEELGPPQDGWARHLLTAASQTAHGCTRDVLAQILSMDISDGATRDKELHWLLELLENDGYLVEAEGRFRFRSNLLRRYWQERFS